MQLNKHKSQVAQLLLSLAVIGTASKAFPDFESLFIITPISLGIILILFLLAEGKDVLSRFTFHFSRFTKSFVLYPLSFVLAFALWSLATTFWSIYPEVTLMRSGYLLFLIITIFVAAHMINWKELKYKFGFLLPLNIIVVISSLISLVFNIPETAWTGGNAKGFMAFTAHQNTLGALILFTSPAAIELFWIKFKERKNSQSSIVNRQSKILTSDFCLLTSAFILCTLTYSRASIASFLILLVLLTLLQGSKLVLLLSTVSITALILSFVLIPSLRNSMKNLLLKDTQSITETRLPLWNASYQAALEGGIFGLGYGVSHPEIQSGGMGDHNENGRFVREKGNSILAMIEEVGIVGLILFVLPIFLTLFYLIQGMQEGIMERWKNETMVKSVSDTHNIDTQHSNIPDLGNALSNISADQTFQYSNIPIFQIDSSPSHPFSFSPSQHYFSVSLAISFILTSAFHAQFESWWVGVGSTSFIIFISIIAITSSVIKVN
jgi:O-antigen ligase